MSWITFVKIKAIGNYFSYFHFYTKNIFLHKNEIRGIISNGLELDKCYQGHDPEQ